MDTNEVLLPCPFCGFAAMALKDWQGIWAVRCNNDGTLGKELASCNTAGPEAATEAEAIAAWNTRKLAPPLPAEDGELAHSAFLEGFATGWNAAMSGENPFTGGNGYWAKSATVKTLEAIAARLEAAPQSLRERDAPAGEVVERVALAIHAAHPDPSLGISGFDRIRDIRMKQATAALAASSHERDGLREALRPFAEHPEFHAPDDWPVTYADATEPDCERLPGVTAGDFRKAREAYFSHMTRQKHEGQP